LDKGDFCCGYPAELAGFRKAAIKNRREVFQHALKEKVEEIVTPCPGCYKWLSEKSKIKVKHIMCFLSENIEKWSSKLKPLNIRVVYHDPCELGRYHSIYDEPREILKAIPGLELIEFKFNRDKCTCCGGGGLLFAIEPELSLGVALQKIKSEVEPLNVDYIVSACPTCYRVFSYAIEKAESQVKMADLAEILSKALG